MPTKIEMTPEQSQQGVSNDVLVSIEGVEELKKKLKMESLLEPIANKLLKDSNYLIHSYRVVCFETLWIRRRCCSLIPAKLDSSPHVHAQTTKTYQTSRFKNQESSNIKTKISANSDLQDLPSRNQVYQGRLLASFQDDPKREMVRPLETFTGVNGQTIVDMLYIYKSYYCTRRCSPKDEFLSDLILSTGFYVGTTNNQNDDIDKDG
nr:hypothetical protein [Tanacetum cinerariifolium]